MATLKRVFLGVLGLEQTWSCWELPWGPERLSRTGPHGGGCNKTSSNIDSFLLGAEVATRSSILAWKILWTEEPGGLQSVGSQRVRHEWATGPIMFPVLYALILPIDLMARIVTLRPAHECGNWDLAGPRAWQRSLENNWERWAHSDSRICFP